MLIVANFLASRNCAAMPTGVSFPHRFLKHPCRYASGPTIGRQALRDAIAGQFSELRPDAAKRRALVTLSTMVGAMTLARMVTDPSSRP